MKDEDASQDWVAAGLAELATAGVDGVRVEVLAEQWAPHAIRLRAAAVR